MKGRRYPDVPDAFDAHERMEAGGYRRIDYGKGVGWQWEIRDPHDQLGRLGDHTVTEHEDGTITVSPSIASPVEGGYHGFLERGVWRDA